MNIGYKTNLLTVVSIVGEKITPRNRVFKLYKCVCDCGGEFIGTNQSIRKTFSCGCTRLEYKIWFQMRDRCRNPKNHAFHNYGGRGIRVCARWEKSFAAFFEDMGYKPEPGSCVERIDNERGYSPDNCRWATAYEQAHNMRTNVWMTHPDGRRMIMKDWARELDMVYGSLFDRRKRGWSDERALTTPIGNTGGSRRRGKVRACRQSP